MILNKELNDTKELYLKTALSDEEIIKGWNLIEEKISISKKPIFFFFSSFRQSFLIAIIIMALLIFSTGTIVNASKHSKPGDFLYPVKEFADNIIETFSNEEEDSDRSSSNNENINDEDDQDEDTELEQDNESEINGESKGKSEGAKGISEEIKIIIDYQRGGDVKGQSTSEDKNSIGQSIKEIILEEILRR